MEALWAVVNATAQRSEEVQVMCAVDLDFLRDVSTAYANHDRHQLARGIMFSRCGLGADSGKLENAARAPRHGPAQKSGSWNARLRPGFPVGGLVARHQAAAHRARAGGRRGGGPSQGRAAMAGAARTAGRTGRRRTGSCGQSATG